MARCAFCEGAVVRGVCRVCGVAFPAGSLDDRPTVAAVKSPGLAVHAPRRYHPPRGVNADALERAVRQQETVAGIY